MEPGELFGVDELPGQAVVEVILKFRDRRQRVPKELDDFGGVEPTESFGKIPANRRCGLLKTVAETEMSRGRLSRTNCDHLRTEFVCELPAAHFSVRFDAHRNGRTHNQCRVARST
jgi:hypothetical protein